MKQPTAQTDRTILSSLMTGGLGEIELLHPPGTFALTPASLIAVEAVANHQALLRGSGIDWGSGSGCLAILAARIPSVNNIVGLEISPANVEIARRNAIHNHVEQKTAFILSDSYEPAAQQDRKPLDALRGRTDFVLANPPSSEGDDGFEYRRIVLRGARDFLVRGGLVFLNVSYQYGPQRVERLTQDALGFRSGGVLAATDWVPFDLSRRDLLHCLEEYAQEEQRRGFTYAFRDPSSRPEAAEIAAMSARSALDHFHRTGQSPLTKWQTLLFRYAGSE